MKFEDPEYWKELINVGLSRFFILRMLNEVPTHGYALLDDLKSFTAGCCTPAYGTIYPFLKELLKGKYAQVKLETKEGRERKVYELTPKGIAAFQVATQAWREVLPILEEVMQENQHVAYN